MESTVLMVKTEQLALLEQMEHKDLLVRLEHQEHLELTAKTVKMELQ
jgi:hypothetical protein